MTIEDMLIQDEGMKLRVYLDTKAKMTIGCGRNLEDVGITEAEALTLLQNDILIARKEASKYSFFSALDPVRQDVIVMMMFNMGAVKFAEFKRLFVALVSEDFDASANEMLGSHWSAQVGKRAVKLAGMMRSGVYPPQ